MRESIAHTFVYNLIIIFVLIVFGLLAAAQNYYKAFKVNNLTISSIEKYEGYNRLSREEIQNNLKSMGYTIDNDFNMAYDCPEKKGATIATTRSSEQIPYRICIYEYNNDSVEERGEKAGSYYNYSVISYIYVDLPVVDAFSIPVHTKAERIYRFTGTGGKSS